MSDFSLRGPVFDEEIIAVRSGVHALAQLYKAYGTGRWRKLKGKALVELPDGSVALAELHSYEAHGIGRRDVRIKRLLE